MIHLSAVHLLMISVRLLGSLVQASCMVAYSYSYNMLKLVHHMCKVLPFPEDFPIGRVQQRNSVTLSKIPSGILPLA